MSSSFQTNLANRRRERGFRSQRALAEASGVSLRSIADYETGETEPTLGVLVKLADALACGLDELVGRETPPPEVHVNGVRYGPLVPPLVAPELEEAASVGGASVSSEALAAIAAGANGHGAAADRGSASEDPPSANFDARAARQGRRGQRPGGSPSSPKKRE